MNPRAYAVVPLTCSSLSLHQLEPLMGKAEHIPLMKRHTYMGGKPAAFYPGAIGGTEVGKDHLPLLGELYRGMLPRNVGISGKGHIDLL